MKLETFFEKFELFADAPGAVDKMRELVLQLAVQGRLVNQSPDDEPADVLAGVIADDRAKFVKVRSLVRSRALRGLEGEEYPYALPPGWKWIRLGNLCRVQAGFAFQSAAFVQGESGVPMIRIRDITKECTQVNYVGEYREEFLVDQGDYLVGMDGNFTVARWQGPRALLNQRVSRLQWYSQHLEPQFFAIALQHRLWELQGTKAYTTVDHLSSGQIENAVVPLPPFPEQKRIAAKVDELMALCDRLEEQQQEREKRHTALARASLSRFAEAPIPANLNLLFHKSYDISPADLRKSILTLAVQGKLVPQTPNTGRADTLGAPDAELEADFSFDIPEGWIVTRLTKLAEINGGFAFKSTAYTEEGTRVVRISDFDEFGFRDHKVVRHPFSRDLQKFALAQDNILMAMTGGTVGKSYLVNTLPEPMVVNQRVATIKVSDSAMPSYIDIVIRSEMTQEVIRTAKNSTNDNVSMGDIKGLAIPLPPLAEQRRIVAKVEQLMSLVDALEIQFAASRAHAEKLLSASVAELTGSSPLERRQLTQMAPIK